MRSMRIGKVLGMGKTLKKESMEFLTSLQSITAENNTKEVFLQNLWQFHFDRAGGLRSYFKR